MYAESIGDQLTDLLGSVVAVAVKVVIFLAIMGLGWIVGHFIYKWLSAFLRQVGFDRGVERGGLHRVLGSTKASDVTARLVEIGFMLFVLQLAFGIFGPNPVSDLIARVVAWLPKLFVAIVIIVVTAAIGGWVKEIIRNALGGLSYANAIGIGVYTLILSLGLIAALNQVGVATTVTVPVLVAALATVAGIAIVGIGGGLIRPMQHRWERMLNRAETETAVARDRVQVNRGSATDRNRNEPGGFGQPAYGGGAPNDTKPLPVEEPTTRPAPPADEG